MRGVGGEIGNININMLDRGYGVGQRKAFGRKSAGKESLWMLQHSRSHASILRRLREVVRSGVMMYTLGG